MLFYLTFFSTSYVCTHDRDIKYLSGTIPEEATKPFKRNLREITWDNIRIKFVFDFIQKRKTDKYMCTKPGQTMYWSSYSGTCNASDILNSTHISNLIKTFENVQSYLQEMIQVIPATSSIKMSSLDQSSRAFDYYPEVAYKDVDLVLPVVLRKYRDDDPTIAQAGWISMDNYKRPTSGIVYLNALRVPYEVQNLDSWNSNFFMVVVHEVCHALGVTKETYKFYHPYETNVAYKNPQCSLTRYGKKFTFLVTPYSHKFAKKRYGVDTFYGDNGENCPAGIELEDGGGPSTAGSHLESRMFISELMIGIILQTERGPFNRFTDALMAVLQDTGNYKVNWSYGRPLVYGNPESRKDGKPIPDFATGIPYNVFPDEYFHKKGDKQRYTGFNFAFSGPVPQEYDPKDIKCPSQYSDINMYCKAPGFYNPTNSTHLSADYVFDFLNYSHPKNVCPKGKAILPGAWAYSNQDEPCGDYVCDGYDSFNITMPTVDKNGNPSYPMTITCTRDNIGQEFSYNVKFHGKRQFSDVRTAYCPDPEVFCRSMKLHEMESFRVDPFDPDSKQLIDPEPKKPTPTPAQPSSEPSSPTNEPTHKSSITPTTKPTEVVKPTTHPYTKTPIKPSEGTKTPEISNSDENSGEGTDEPDDSKNRFFTKKMKYVFIGVGVCALIVIIIVGITVYFVRRKQKSDLATTDVINQVFIV